jgi:hypothetical protein
LIRDAEPLGVLLPNGYNTVRDCLGVFNIMTKTVSEVPIVSRILLLLLLLAPISVLASDVIPKVGSSCPTGMYASGDYCKAFKSTSEKGGKIVANPSGGKCPTGWYRSGDYCKAYSSSAEEDVIEKVGDDCPRGMYTSGGFCKSYR